MNTAHDSKKGALARRFVWIAPGVLLALASCSSGSGDDAAEAVEAQPTPIETEAPTTDAPTTHAPTATEPACEEGSELINGADHSICEGGAWVEYTPPATTEPPTTTAAPTTTVPPECSGSEERGRYERHKLCRNGKWVSDPLARPTTTTAPPPPPTTAAPTETVSQENARQKAAEYLDYSSFSLSGLIEQLEYEGFSEADASYGVVVLNVDWNEQAAKKAAEYLDYSSFSRSGLIDQLLYEGFTQEQAEHGVSTTGL